MYSRDALLDLHRRSHTSVERLIDHCRTLDPEFISKKWDGFGYGSVQLQLHHMFGAIRYWIGVLEGRMDAFEDPEDFPTLDALEAFRGDMLRLVEHYLGQTPESYLNEAKTFTTWGDRQAEFQPARVIVRISNHLYQHQGQITAMCRLAGSPVNGIDFPIL